MKAVSRRFRGLVRRAGLPRFRLYDLRHTYATHLLAERAPITYVAAQLGHAEPTTTLAHYARWLPRGDKQWVDRLAAGRASAEFAPRLGARRGSDDAAAPEPCENHGEPWWDRTTDPLIKSQVLCQLS